jgi:hypothetical protein
MIGGWKNFVATGQVSATPGAIIGFYVNNTTAGTLQLYDDPSAAANAITGLITPAIGWHPFPVKYAKGLRAVIGGTLDVTFIVAR